MTDVEEDVLIFTQAQYRQPYDTSTKAEFEQRTRASLLSAMAAQGRVPLDGATVGEWHYDEPYACYRVKAWGVPAKKF